MTSIASWEVPGTRSLIQGARYLSQLVSSSTNLSSPKAIGAIVNTVRSRPKACSLPWQPRRSRDRDGDAVVDAVVEVLVEEGVIGGSNQRESVVSDRSTLAFLR